jgi:hypothetical protein
MNLWRGILAWLGLNPRLPEAGKIENPVHGMEARNTRSEKVIYDSTLGAWVMPQNFSGRKPVTITKGK